MGDTVVAISQALPWPPSLEVSASYQAWVADPREFSHLPDGSARYKITLDLVVFADGLALGQCILRNQLKV